MSDGDTKHGSQHPQLDEQGGTNAGLSPMRTGQNKERLHDCGKYAWKSYFGQNFGADPTLWCGEEKGVRGREKRGSQETK